MICLSLTKIVITHFQHHQLTLFGLYLIHLYSDLCSLCFCSFTWSTGLDLPFHPPKKPFLMSWPSSSAGHYIVLFSEHDENSWNFTYSRQSSKLCCCQSLRLGIQYNSSFPQSCMSTLCTSTAKPRLKLTVTHEGLIHTFDMNSV